MQLFPDLVDVAVLKTWDPTAIFKEKQGQQLSTHQQELLRKERTKAWRRRGSPRARTGTTVGTGTGTGTARARTKTNQTKKKIISQRNSFFFSFFFWEINIVWIPLFFIIMVIIKFRPSWVALALVCKIIYIFLFFYFFYFNVWIFNIEIKKYDY